MSAPTVQTCFCEKNISVPCSDAELLARFRGGDDEAATHLYHRYKNRIEALAKAQCGADLAPRLDAEDIVQSVFRFFFRDAALGHYQVGPEENLWNLLMVMTLNAIRSEAQYHRAARRDVRTTKSESKWYGALAKPVREQQATELRLLITDLQQSLPEHQQQVIQLRLDGHDVAAIAEQTHLSKRTVERVLQNFRTTLREKLRDE